MYHKKFKYNPGLAICVHEYQARKLPAKNKTMTVIRPPLLSQSSFRRWGKINSGKKNHKHRFINKGP